MRLGRTLPPTKRVRKALVELSDERPFYGRVAMQLTVADASDRADVPTAGVTADGTFFVDPSFVGDLSASQLRGLVAHEVLHLVLDFSERRLDRDLQRWNTAQDAVINHYLVEDGFALPEGVVPEDGRVQIGEHTVDDIGAKTSESIYDELTEVREALDDLDGPNRVAGRVEASGGDGDDGSESDDDDDDDGITGGDGAHEGDADDADRDPGADAGGDDDAEATETIGPGETGEPDGEREETDDPRASGDAGDATPAAQNPGGFDVHLDDLDMVVDGDGPDWDRIAVQAAQAARREARNRGTDPAAIVERVRRAHSEQVGWRTLLREEVTGRLPAEYTWERPADKSRPAGTYLPATESRKLDAVVALDTSASMGTDQVATALGELRSLAREFDDLDVTMLQHDAAVHRVDDDWQGGRPELEIEGRGGTSHVPVFEWCRENRPDADLLVAVTDGRTDVPDPPLPCDVVWLLVGTDVETPALGRAVRVLPRSAR
jgi:predicted metal-dependent peptidase